MGPRVKVGDFILDMNEENKSPLGIVVSIEEEVFRVKWKYGESFFETMLSKNVLLPSLTLGRYRVVLEKELPLLKLKYNW